MWNKIKIFAKGYGFMTVIITVIATGAIKYDRHDVMHEELKVSDEYLMEQSREQSAILHEILYKVQRMENAILYQTQVNENIQNSIKATNQAFLRYISHNNTLTKSDFLNYMNSIEFYLKVDEPTPQQKGWDSLSIRVEPIKK